MEQYSSPRAWVLMETDIQASKYLSIRDLNTWEIELVQRIHLEDKWFFACFQIQRIDPKFLSGIWQNVYF